MNNFHRFQNFRQFSNLLKFCFRKFDWKSETRHSFLKFVAKSGQNFKKNHRKDVNFDAEHENKWKFIVHSRKNVDDFWLNFWDWRTVRRSALCRSRQELSNEYLLAKIGVDTAENEPCKVCPLSAYRSPRYVRGLVLDCIEGRLFPEHKYIFSLQDLCEVLEELYTLQQSSLGLQCKGKQPCACVLRRCRTCFKELWFVPS